MKRSTLYSLFTLLILIPLTLYWGAALEGNSYYLISTLIILEAILPFFFSFEAKKPQARELVMLAVMTALASISRSAFAFLPHFKPVTAIIMLTGISFGAQAGFLTGALTAFVSNFIFGQGFWTPWQMFSYGVGGFLAGLLFHNRPHLSKTKIFPIVYALFGFVTVVLLVGPILDCSSLFMFSSRLNWASAVTIFSVGLPVNITHGISCAITLLLFSKPLLSKLTRLQQKYGMLNN